MRVTQGSIERGSIVDGLGRYRTFAGKSRDLPVNGGFSGELAIAHHNNAPFTKDKLVCGVTPSKSCKGKSVFEFRRILQSRRSLAILFAVEIVLIAWFAFVGGSTQGSLQHLLHVDDKVMHMAAFTCAGLTAFLLWSPVASASILFAGASSVELIQRFIPGRESSLSDLGASLGGGALGGAAALILAVALLPKVDAQQDSQLGPGDRDTEAVPATNLVSS